MIPTRKKISLLEEKSNVHQRSINSFYGQFSMILDYLNVEIEETPKITKLVPKKKKEKKNGKTDN
jgi:hypothetical protein